MNILVTGGAGFIGSVLIDKLLEKREWFVYSVDNYDDFYEKSIKLRNQENHFRSPNFEFIEHDIRNINVLNVSKPIDIIIHLAAKAGVRPSIDKADEYCDVNINGTLQMLEFARKNNVKQFIFGSSSSVYGINPNTPWREEDYNLMPISPYASSKFAAEKIGFTYSHLFGIRFLALRFFTVYGHRQRPDLAISKFIQSIVNRKGIEIYGDGTSSRDYTFVDDIVDGIIKSMSFNKTMYEIINLGNSQRISLLSLVNSIAKELGVDPIIVFKEEQQGDVPHTCADISKAVEYLNYSPYTSIESGIIAQVNWYKMINHDSKVLP